MSTDNEDRLDTADESDRPPSLKRRTMLASTAGAVTAVAGFGAFAGTVAAWGRFEVDFKGCSEVWMIVDDDDLDYDPPTVARVIVETADGGTDYRPVEFTEEAATTIPGQYGDAPLVKYAVDDSEKVLAVLLYNYREIDRFSDPSCLLVNDHRCAQAPNTADLYEADCVQAAYDGRWGGSYWDGSGNGNCADRIVGREGPSKGGRGSSNSGGGGGPSNGGGGPPDGRGGSNRGGSRGQSRGPPR
ncbi:hypothetical protein HWV23_15720 [Natronomonas halophila]|uniref:hypothetical protein n=1 Tax=Natronomonas halophila TaxID=2747817 RepID=UPI0015B75FBD|nr:hypothetical protein [Natronomonas halophila]QLD87110.1 hypothetical protein HWV23_15720 [Natronomonas halophila]